MTSSASHRIAAVTPEPQLVMTGRDGSMPAAATAARMVAASTSWPSFTTSDTGRLRAPGIWPGRTPARGSGASPRKRSAARASSTCALPSASRFATSSMEATQLRSSLASKRAG